VTETDRDGLDPAEMNGLGCFGFADGVGGRYYRLRLSDPASLERLMPAARKSTGSSTPRSRTGGSHDLLDVGGDVEAKRGLSYARTA
jgi:hypothetical protein